VSIFGNKTDAVDDGGVKRDRWGRYLLKGFTPADLEYLKDHGRVAAGGKLTGHTRATTFAKSISDTFTLSQWGLRMAVKGLAMRPDLYAMAAALPLEDRDGLNKVAEQAKDAAGAKSAAALGTALHAFTEAMDKGEKPNVPAPWVPDVAAYARLIQDAGLRFAPEHIERIVMVSKFGVAGTFDRIAQLTRDLDLGDGITLKTGTWVVVDLKTGRDLTYGWNEIAIQLALYAHADAMVDDADEGTYTALPELDKNVALVIHLPVGQAKATLHAVDIELGMRAAELCHQVRTWRKVRKLAVPVAVASSEEGGWTDTAPGVMTASADPRSLYPAIEAARTGTPTVEDRINACSSREELKTVWLMVTDGGRDKAAWTPAYQTLVERKLGQISTV